MKQLRQNAAIHDVGKRSCKATSDKLQGSPEIRPARMQARTQQTQSQRRQHDVGIATPPLTQADRPTPLSFSSSTLSTPAAAPPPP
jgi:hypothetical protein